MAHWLALQSCIEDTIDPKPAPEVIYSISHINKPIKNRIYKGQSYYLILTFLILFDIKSNPTQPNLKLEQRLPFTF